MRRFVCLGDRVDPPPHLKKSHLDHIAADAESRTWQLVRLRGSE